MSFSSENIIYRTRTGFITSTSGIRPVDPNLMWNVSPPTSSSTLPKNYSIPFTLNQRNLKEKPIGANNSLSSQDNTQNTNYTPLLIGGALVVGLVVFASMNKRSITTNSSYISPSTT